MGYPARLGGRGAPRSRAYRRRQRGKRLVAEVTIAASRRAELDPRHILISGSAWSVIWLFLSSTAVATLGVTRLGSTLTNYSGNPLGWALGNVWFGFFMVIPLCLVGLGVTWLLSRSGASTLVACAIPVLGLIIIAVAVPEQAGELALIPLSAALAIPTSILSSDRMTQLATAIATSFALFIGTLAVWAWALFRRDARRWDIVAAAGVLPVAILAVDSLRPDATGLTPIALIAFGFPTMLASIQVCRRKLAR